MKFRIFILLAFSSFFVFRTAAAQIPDPRREARQLQQLLLSRHIVPKQIDNKFSSDVFDYTIDLLDPERLYFTAADLAGLAQFRFRIDDEFNGSDWHFTTELQQVYKKALKRAERNINEMCVRPFDFTRIALPDTAWARDATALKQRIELELKVRAWHELLEGSLKSGLSESAYFAANEVTVRTSVKRQALRNVNRQLRPIEGFGRLVVETYFRAFSMTFDPHSVYMSRTQIQNMIRSASTEGYFLGFALEETERGEIAITGLHPGGPAWKSGALAVGDVIEKVRWAGSQWVETKGMSGDEFGELVDRSNNKPLEFAIRKGTGAVRTVMLRKERFSPQYNVARGFVLEGRHRVGYIILPDFYSDWNGTGSARCAQDVDLEIRKLVVRGVEGIILDVRSNTGGSLAEAVDVTGLFIDEGPIGIDLMRNEEPYEVKDESPGATWDGPLLILTGANSASASEFLAGALQDYRRAIIAGGRTYGKAIAQELYSVRSGQPVEDFSVSRKNGGWGFCAVTTSKMYRLNGKSIQSIGITPDIIIPQWEDLFIESEGDSRFALRADSINLGTEVKVLPPLPLKDLAVRSQNRIDTTSGFQAIKKYRQSGARLLELESGDIAAYKTGLCDYFQDYTDVSHTMEKVKAGFRISYPGADDTGVDEYTKTLNGTWIRELSKDLTLDEAYQVVCDFIELGYSQ